MQTALKTELVLRWLKEAPGSPGKGQKEGQRGLGDLNNSYMRSPLALHLSLVRLAVLLALPCAPWNSIKPLYLGDRAEATIARGVWRDGASPLVPVRPFKRPYRPLEGL